MNTVIAGGTGFLGRALAREFGGESHEVVCLSRSTKAVPGARTVTWDAKTIGPWAKELDGAEALINVVGESVAQRWTDDVRRRLLTSRVDSTCVLGEAISRCDRPPPIWINASAVGYFGDTGDSEVDESSPPGDDFLASVCVRWERALADAQTPRTRKHAVRIGFVLGHGGGAFDTIWKLAKWFLGGAVGRGRNWIPWIHIDDLGAIFRCSLDAQPPRVSVLERAPMSVVNGVGPAPVTFNELMREVRRAAGRPWAPNVPLGLAKLGEVFGAPPAELAAQSSRVVSRVLRDARFEYKFPTLRSALADLSRKKR